MVSDRRAFRRKRRPNLKSLATRQAHYSPVDEEITKLTGELWAAEPPLTGSWLITLPAATVLLVC